MDGFTGENVPEAAEPASVELTGGDTGANGAGDAARQAPQAESMSMEDRSAAAQARRRAEAESRAEIARMQQRQEALARSRGFGSFEEMVEFSNRELLNQKGLSPDVLSPVIESLLESHPAIQSVRAMERQQTVDRAMREFQADHPDAGIRSVADFVKMPTYTLFYDYVSRGLSFSEAYELANRGDLKTQRAAAARQSVLNAVNGKGHMLSEAGGGADDLMNVAVPAETMGFYRAMHPSWDDRKIRNHYARTQKGMT